MVAEPWNTAGASNQPPQKALDDAVCDALEGAIAALSEKGEAGLSDFFAAHPTHEAAVRRRLALLRERGMLGALPDEPSAPERLGEFVLGARLGSGGMGVVYAATQPSLGRQVALKLIRPEHLYFPGARERFRREIAAIAGLDHPGIVRVFCAGEDGGVPYYAMEHVVGLSLDRLLDQLRGRAPATLDERCVRELIACDPADDVLHARGARGRRWAELCCRWVCDLALAIDHAHRAGVLHRDIKPGNVIVTKNLGVKLLDFGLASTREGSRLTRTGSQLGSLPYMAPEQVEGDTAAIDARTDVYALGVTLFELLTLHSPFLREGQNDAHTRRLIVHGITPKIGVLNPAVGWDAETVCRVAMDPDPRQRYASAADFARDLHSVLELRTIAARRPGVVRRITRWAQRHPARTVAAVLGALIVLVGPTLFALRERIAVAKVTRANQDAQVELATKDAILSFLNEDLLAAVAPEEAGRNVSMREVLDRAAARIEGKFAGQPLVEAAVRDTLGHTYRSLGAYAEAEAHQLRAVELFLAHRGATHQLTLGSKRKLAQIYLRQERLHEAAELGAEVVRQSEAALGPEHGDTLSAKNNLGLVLVRQRQFALAEPLLHAVVDARRRQFGDEHRQTLTAMANLGLLYHQWGKLSLAEPLYRLDLEGSRKTLHGDHPELLVTLNNWANLQSALGNDEESRAVREDLLVRYERVHGPRHALTIQALCHLGYVLSRIGKHDDAGRKLQDAILRSSDLAPDDGTALHARTALAAAQLAAGDAPASLSTIDEALSTIRASARPLRTPRLRAERLRIQALIVLQRWADAERQSAQTLTDLETDGPGASVAEVMTFRGKCLHELVSHAQAERMLLAAETMWQEHAPKAEFRRVGHRELIRVYLALGQEAAAETWRAAERQWQADAEARKQD